jgi:hypothetical protein
MINVDDISWDPKRNENPTAVVSIEINGTKYIMDLMTYNDNIEAGKTRYVTRGESLFMVTEEEYKLLYEANELYFTLEGWKSNQCIEAKNPLKEAKLNQVEELTKLLHETPPVLKKKKGRG